MFEDLKPFVPSEICLSCEGCCRFREEHSAFRPKVFEEERLPAGQGLESYAGALDAKGYVQTVPGHDEFFCRFFAGENHICRVYPLRPLECRLYPFMLATNAGGVALVAHRLCPFIEKNQGTAAFAQYVRYLKDYFRQSPHKDFLHRYAASFEHCPGPAEDFTELLTLLSNAKKEDDEELLAHRPMTEQYLSKTPHALSAFSFVNIFAWKDFFDFDFKIIDDNLCVFARQAAGVFLYLPPLGSRLSPEALEASLTLMREQSRYPSICRIENIEQNQKEAFAMLAYDCYKKGEEYIYLKEDIAALKGNRLKSQRNDYNHFVKNYHPRFLPFELSFQGDCCRLYEAWMAGRLAQGPDDMYRQTIQENKIVHARVLKYFKELGCTARVVTVDDELVAYTLGYPLTREMFCVLFEITHADYRGLSAYVFREFCADEALKPFSLINAMDDFGLANLKKTKMSFHPLRLEAAYNASAKK